MIGFTSENFKKTTAKILTKTFKLLVKQCVGLVIIVKELALYLIDHHVFSFNW